MTTQRTTQPANVSTEDAPRPPDENVVTSDLPSEPPAAETKATAPKAAATAPGGPNDTDPAPAATDNQAPKPTRNRSAERRISKLTQKLSAAEAKEAENARRIEELQETVDTLQSAAPKAKEPQLQDFASPREFGKAYAKWAAETEDNPPPKPARKPRTPAADKSPAPEPQPITDPQILAFHKRGQDKLGDEFGQALKDTDTAVSQVMGEFLMDSEVGPELYVYLTDHTDEARVIFDQSAPKAIKSLEALAAKATKGELDADPEPGETPPEATPPGTTKQSKAPTPPSDTQPAGSTTTVNPETESMEEYGKRRKREEAERAGFVN